MGVPLSETFLREHRESISCCFIEAGRAGVRLPPAVQLPPLAQANGQAPEPEAVPPSHGHDTTLEGPRDHPAAATAPPNGATAPSPAVLATAADLPTRIPAGLELPCAEALIVDLRPPQLSLLIGKVGLRALADKTLEPLHVALLAERARRVEAGQRPEASANGA
jgi:hypothetical protein